MIRLRPEAPSTSYPLPSSTPPSRTPPLLPIPLPTSSPPLLLPSTSHREDVLEVTLPPQKRLCIALGLRFKVGESSSSPTDRPIGGFRVDYGFVGTLDDEIRRDPKREVKDIKETDKIEAKTEQNQEQTGSVEKSKVKPDKKIPVCYDDDDEDYTIAITYKEPDNSLSMRDKHLDTLPAMKSDEFIKSSVENLVPNLSESEGEYEFDVPAFEDFTTFSNLLFDADYDFSSSNDQSFYNEDIPKEIYSNPLFDKEIISMKIDPHHFNVESDLIESLLNHDSLIISSSSKIDSLFDEFASELTLLKSIPLGISETHCYPEEETCLIKILLYDNSSPHPSKEFISENSDAAFESFSPFTIPVEDSDSFMEEIDLSFTPNDLMPPEIEDDDYDSERDILILE
nr:hypothetical protein [Tanacetum cinerariifolium]